MGVYVDLSGTKVGLLTIIKDVGRNKFHQSIWLARCECGNEVTRPNSMFRKAQKDGSRANCGCLKSLVAGENSRNNATKISKAKTTHGHSKHYGPLQREYWIWGTMVQRCTNPKNRKFPAYGGRGISVHPSWLKFENFIKDMGSRPSRNLSIDRINNDGNYEPGNCRWATPKEQSANQRPRTRGTI